MLFIYPINAYVSSRSKTNIWNIPICVTTIFSYNSILCISNFSRIKLVSMSSLKRAVSQLMNSSNVTKAERKMR